jgi:hypothetical protein
MRSPSGDRWLSTLKVKDEYLSIKGFEYLKMFAISKMGALFFSLPV